MKRKILFLSTFLFFVFLIGCNDDKNAEFLEVNEESFDLLGEDGDGGSFMIKSNTEWTVTCSDDNWLKCTPTSGKGDAGVVLSAAYNTTANIRTGAITVSTPGGISRTIIVAQFGTEPGIIARPETLAANSGGGIINIRVTSTHEWEVIVPDNAKDWISVSTAQTTSLKGWAVLRYELNETDKDRSADVVFKLKNGDKTAVVNILQAFIVPPEGVSFEKDAVLGMRFTVSGKYLSSIAKVFFGETEAEIVSLTDELLTVNVPATASEGLVDLRIIYGTKEMNLGTVNVIPPFPSVTSMPGKAQIGMSFVIHGSMFNVVEKVILGNTEATFERGKTPNYTMMVTVPATAREGAVDVKFIYLGGSELKAGTINLDYHTCEPGKDLARYAGSVLPDVPKIFINPNRHQNAGANNGRLALYAFDGVIVNADYANVDYATIYAGIEGTPPINPNNRTFWQMNSNAIFGDIPEGLLPSTAYTPQIWVGLDYSETKAGYVTFDEIRLVPREAGSVVKKYAVDVSDNQLYWVRVFESTEEFPNTQNTLVTHNLKTPVQAKYVRWVCLETTAANTGLSVWQLYCTK